MTATNLGDNTFTGHLNAIKNNDRHAIRQLYLTNYPIAERYILQNSGSAEEAKDFFQEAVIVVWRNIQLEKFVPQTIGALNAYLLQVSKNKWIDHLRSVSFKKTLALDDRIGEMEAAATDTQDDHFITAVTESVKELGGQCKEVLTDFYYNKLSMRDIAAAFGWTEATARNNKYRCIEKLKLLLKQKNIQPGE